MIITQTPLRVSLAGGGTDFADYYRRRDGYVVSAGIDKSVFVIVSARHDDKIYVNYTRKEIVDHVDQIQHELVREAMRLTGVQGGVEVTMLSDIPSEGSGLGSSSSFTVGLLNAFHQHQRRQVGPAQLADEACEVEIVRCGKPIGKQDQYIAAYGGLTAFRFRADGSVDVEPLPLGEAELRRLSANLFLFYSNQTRSADSILAEQKQRIEANLEELDGIRALAFQAHASLARGEFHRLGPILDENWRRKRLLASQISNDRIDAMHRRAMEAGAGGAKVCGAGGGGFLLVYCRPERQAALLKAMAGYREMPFHVELDGSKVIFNYRRTSWRWRALPPTFPGE